MPTAGTGAYPFVAAAFQGFWGKREVGAGAFLLKLWAIAPILDAAGQALVKPASSLG